MKRDEGCLTACHFHYRTDGMLGGSHHRRLIMFLWLCVCVCVSVYTIRALMYMADNRNRSGEGVNSKFYSEKDFTLAYSDYHNKHTLSNTTILTCDILIQ